MAVEEVDILPSLTSAAAPTWLDRLRTSKGFPLPHPDLHLDHFLTPNPNPTPTPSPPPLPPPPVPNPPTNPTWFDLVNSALAELFRIGDPEQHPKTRCRKQSNPRVCLQSVPAAENSAAGRRRGGKKRGVGGGRLEKKVGALGECSRTEVTVVDTSCEPCWKSEKVVYRKGAVWRIRDKKFTNLPRKRRRLGGAGGGGGESGVEMVKLNVGDGNHQKPQADGEEAQGKENIPKEEKAHNSSSQERRLHPSRSSRNPASKGLLVFPSHNTAAKSSVPS